MMHQHLDLNLLLSPPPTSSFAAFAPSSDGVQQRHWDGALNGWGGDDTNTLSELFCAGGPKRASNADQHLGSVKQKKSDAIEDLFCLRSQRRRGGDDGEDEEERWIATLSKNDNATPSMPRDHRAAATQPIAPTYSHKAYSNAACLPVGLAVVCGSGGVVGERGLSRSDGGFVTAAHEMAPPPHHPSSPPLLSSREALLYHGIGGGDGNAFNHPTAIGGGARTIIGSAVYGNAAKSDLMAKQSAQAVAQHQHPNHSTASSSSSSTFPPPPPPINTFKGQQYQQRMLEAIAEIVASPMACGDALASTSTGGGIAGGASLPSAFVPPSLAPLLAVEAIEAREDRQKRRRAEATSGVASGGNGAGGLYYQRNGVGGLPARQIPTASLLLPSSSSSSRRLHPTAPPSFFVEGKSGGLAAACEALKAEAAALKEEASHRRREEEKSHHHGNQREGDHHRHAWGFRSGGGGVHIDQHTNAGKLLPEGLTAAQRFALMLRSSDASMNTFAAPTPSSIAINHQRHGRVLQRGIVGGGGGGVGGSNKGIALGESASSFGDTYRSATTTTRAAGGLGERAVIGGGGSASSPALSSPCSPTVSDVGSSTSYALQVAAGGAPMQSLLALMSLGVDPDGVAALLERGR